MPSTLRSVERRWLALPVILVGAFMAILDVFIVFATAPSLQHDLGASPGQVQWVVDGYVMAYALGLITGGRLGDVYGRRRCFMAGIAIFTAASALCGAAPTPAALIAARVIQGLGAALMWPQVLSIIQVEFGPDERRRCFALMGGVQGAASILGQIAGGGLIAADVLSLGWRTVFLVNVPIGLAGLVAAARLVPESRSPSAHRLDLGGVALGTAALLLVVAPIVEGRAAGWPWWVPAALVAAVPVGFAWLRYERRLGARGGSPLVELSLFRLRGFRLGVALALIFFMGIASFFLLLALYLQDGLGLSALSAGAVFTPLAVAFVAASLGSPRLFARVGERAIAAGAALQAIGMAGVIAEVAGGAGAPTPGLIASLIVVGAGNGTVVPAVINAVLRSVPVEDAGSASGVLSTGMQIGNALGVASAGVIFFAVLGSGHGAHAYGHAFAIAIIWCLASASVSALLALRLTRCEPAMGPASVPAVEA
jgi:EmrB/QacA subfamily drug resistance transporter